MKGELRRIMAVLLSCLLLPAGEAQGEESKRFTALKIHEIMRQVQPYLEEQDWLEPCPEHAMLTWEDVVYIPTDFSEVIAMAEQESAPDTVNYFHCSPGCAPGLITEVNFMAIHFWGADQAFLPCPVCFPDGLKLLIHAKEMSNQKICLTIGRYDSLLNDLYDSSKIILQLALENYSIDAVSQYAGLSEYPPRTSPEPVYHPCYLAEPYQNAQYAEACPDCFGENFRLENWAALDGDWVYCINCGIIWNAVEGRALAKY